MRKLWAAGAAMLVAVIGVQAAGARPAEDSLTGAGSSFVAPLVAQWISEWGAKAGIQVTYSPIGSGGGIAAITSRTVDFGASDAPLTQDQFSKCNGCVQIPWALSATSIAYNISGQKGHLHMTGPVLADIYLGKVKKWNDAEITKLNPGASLPDLDITPVYRSDGSGTSYNFTDYLSKVSPEWKSKVGKSTQPSFPVGTGARGSAGVAGVVSRTDGSLTYVDVAYTLKNHLNYFDVQNRAGHFMNVSLRNIAASAGAFKGIAPDNSISIVDPPKTAVNAYPICTYTYVIAPIKSPKANTLRKFIFYAVGVGQKQGPKLLFVPLPKPILIAAEKTIAKIQPQT